MIRNPLVARAKANGITRDQYFGRVSRGWNPEDAATTPADTPSRRWAPKLGVRAVCRLIASIPVAPQQDIL